VVTPALVLGRRRMYVRVALDACRVPLSRGDVFAVSRKLEIRNWKLEIRNWKLEIGNWKLEFNIK